MKKNNSPLLLLFIFLMMISGKMFSQTFTTSPQITPGGFFDEVYDQFGNQYELANLNLSSHSKYNGATINTSPTASCSSGYFNAYFAAGSYWDTHPTAQNALCQLLNDISNFISSPLAAPGNTVKVNLYFDNLDATAIANGVGGTASSFFLVPFSPSNPNQGVMDNVVQQTIISGQDPYANIAAGVFAIPSNFYHGYININPNISWHLNTNSASVSNSDYDLYTVFLHEITHSLGFMSMINGDGFSRAGQNNNIFARYDQFLHNSANSPLLTSALSSPYNITNLAFSGSTLAISQGICPGTAPGVNSCSTAARYISSNVNVKVYTPECYAEGSSLSHFEDMCSTPGSFTPAAGCNTVTPANDNLYFVMSNGGGQGSCYVKRYLKEEERYVLCDLGYSVSSVYSSSAAAASHTYIGSSCGGTTIWGVNDGIQNGLYTYTATAGVTTISIPINGGILANDAVTASQIGGVQIIYNNATYTIQGNNLIITAGLNVSGLVLIKYYPSTGSTIGNATYIYAYFTPGSCSPPSPCNMVQNGGFENLLCGICGPISDGTCGNNNYPVTVSCWERVETPDLYAAGCSGGPAPPNPNIYNNILGMWAETILGTNGVREAAKNILSSPLIPGQTYQLSFSAYNTSDTYLLNPNQRPLVITVTSAPLTAANLSGVFPNGLDILTQFTLSTVNMWTVYTHTFIFTPSVSVPQGAVVIGTDSYQTGILNGSADKFYCFIDNISLLPTPAPPFSIPNNVVCGSLTFTNLAQYTPSVSGSFSGVGVTNTGGQYDFNLSGTLSPGSYPIVFTYTAINGCVNNLYQNIILTAPPSITLSANSNSICIGVSVTLTTAGNFTSVNWQPTVSANVPIIVISPTVTTVYTATASNVCGNATSSITVTVFTSPTFSIPNAMSCGTASLSNLQQYITPMGTVGITGVFSGLGVTNSGGQYHFNSALTLSPGVYPVVFSYTTANGCTDNLYQSVLINAASVSVSASSSIVCAGGSVSLTASGNYGYVFWLPGATFSVNPLVVSPAVTTVYTVQATIPNCGSPAQATITVTVAHPPVLNLSSSNSSTVCSGSPVILTASGSYTSIVWQPGSFTTGIVSVNPTVNTVYTATASTFCGSTVQTINVPVVSPNPSTSYTALGTVLSGIYTGISPAYGYYVIAANTSVSGAATFSFSEITLAQNVKITVPAGSTLTIDRSYLHTCDNNMWQGIVVEDGGMVRVYNNSLIEDALTAIDASDQFTSTVQPVILAQNAIFNKNYKDITLTNYTSTAVTYSNVLKIENSVFTCRDIPFGVITGVLHIAGSSTTGLVAPYLQNYSTAAMKWPYANTQARGILLNNVGYTDVSGNYYGISIGNGASPDAFNLFDRHGAFINAENSNLTLQNNVFQNQTGGFIIPSANGNPMYGISAAAVTHRTYDTRQTQLDMSAANTDVGNRFWDCNRGVEGLNISALNVSNAILRSTHTQSDMTQPYPLSGEYGISVNSNRLSYYINNNEFTNISVGINVPINTYIGATFSALAVYNNTFSAGAPDVNGFMSIAVNITSPLYIIPLMPSPLPELPIELIDYPMGGIIPPGLPWNFRPRGLAVVNNSASRVWNGINVSGGSGFPVWIAQNQITLTAMPVDASTSAAAVQRGIELSGAISSGNAKQYVWLNEVQGDAAYTGTNTNISTVYCCLNNGYESPRVSCNHVSNANKGFTFAGYNIGSPGIKGTQWLGNSMENMQNGMLLEGAVNVFGSTLEGVIGQQGDGGCGMGNAWINLSAWTGSLNGIYTNNSTATLSPLYALTSSTYNNPPNPGSLFIGQEYGIGNGIINSADNYYCFAPQAISEPTNHVIPDFKDKLQSHIAKAQLYTFLRYNDSIKDSNGEFQAWYNEITDAGNPRLQPEILGETPPPPSPVLNFAPLARVQDYLYEGDADNATNLLNTLKAANYIEENDIAFYNLYAHYLGALRNRLRYKYSDSLTLTNMAKLCPIEYGVSVYKARALYNSMYNTVMMYGDCNVEKRDARLASFNSPTESQSLKQSEGWKIDLFPNPASDKITLTSNKEHEELFVVITDLVGRKLLSTHLIINAHTADMEIPLINGAYMITITNNMDKSIVKKLLIVK